ncbi:response regulator transcription factor [Mesorhizobium sp. M00.F.Ca.ET.151.01.1.1]|nr:response regulator transcription factor [bacterium M00.F.Ca.ET.199.01.1.1]TGT01735.1 response regulator transcription factor [bacterium M00.F.Ca.ET.177.01.1.1]TGT59075.1 response regulator transcription factor [Mesorhizobium sp. M00.F.Ca.ET.170.01.1.1]TGU11105.1 response regulator transcription factor [bacterium M00.F.Ca.ET.163.01.1.1]TGU92745.1 response regulator transcription factor [Mesorhizobium sp. M00.F.Ca.ET.151.01.1.1]TGV54699.1 response regulator transcription factor [bacterium M00
MIGVRGVPKMPVRRHEFATTSIHYASRLLHSPEPSQLRSVNKRLSMGSEQVTRIVVADDHPVVRLGTRLLLEQDPANIVTGEAGDVDELVTCLNGTPCDLVILSLQLREGRYHSGTSVIAGIRRSFPQLKIVAFPDRCSIQSVRTAISLGVLGVVSKIHTTNDLLRAVDCAKRGQRFVASDLYMAIAGKSPPLRITPAEEAVLQLLSDGHSVTEIAEALGKSAGTVSAQKHSAMYKLGLGTRSDLYAFLSTWQPHNFRPSREGCDGEDHQNRVPAGGFPP